MLNRLSQTLSRRGLPSLCRQPLTNPSRALSTLHPSQIPNTPRLFPRQNRHRNASPLLPASTRNYATHPTASALIEDITEQYATARDEFEIATEETDKHSVYAQADREAARTELDKLKEIYESALGIEGEVGEEIKRRGVGGRIRELEAAVVELERRALEDH